MKPQEAAKLSQILQSINEITKNEAIIEEWDDHGRDSEIVIRVNLSEVKKNE
jgi:hypothetical protein